MIFKKTLCFFVIYWCCIVCANGNRFTRYMKDSAITSKVKYGLMMDKQISGLKISVTTVDGTVFLKGKLKSQNEIDKAVEIVKKVSEVVEVKNQLTIETEEKHPTEEGGYFQKIVIDSSITAAVKTAYLANQNINGVKIKVTTKSGVVYLEGRCDSKRQRDFAEKVARDTYGVKDVKNFIQASR